MLLSLSGHDVQIATVADAQPYWETICQQQSGEVWLEATEDGPSLAILVSGQRAMLMYLPNPFGDLGYTSRDVRYDGAPSARTMFRLGNGQKDEQPTAWTIPLNDALTAGDYFIQTQGDKSPNISWHDDSNDDDLE